MSAAGSILIRIVALTLAMTAAILALPMRAVGADTDGLSISTNGTEYESSGSTSLFPEGIRLVPGGRQHATLHVENASDRNAVLTIRLGGLTSSTMRFAEALTLTATTSADETAEGIILADIGSRADFISERLLEPGQSSDVLFELAMADVTDAIGQGEWTQFNLVVTLQDATLPEPDGESDRGVIVPAFPQEGSAAEALEGRLAETGPEIVYLILAISALFLGAGIYMVLIRGTKSAL